MATDGSALDRARRDSGLTRSELWLRCFALGGTATPRQLDAVLRGGREPDDLGHDRLAHALFERSRELGRDPSGPPLACGRP